MVSFHYTFWRISLALCVCEREITGDFGDSCVVTQSPCMTTERWTSRSGGDLPATQASVLLISIIG